MSYFARFACNDTFTTSNGFTMIASVAPAPSPASEYVYRVSETIDFNFNSKSNESEINFKFMTPDATTAHDCHVRIMATECSPVVSAYQLRT